MVLGRSEDDLSDVEHAGSELPCVVGHPWWVDTGLHQIGKRTRNRTLSQESRHAASRHGQVRRLGSAPAIP